MKRIKEAKCLGRGGNDFRKVTLQERKLLKISDKRRRFKVGEQAIPIFYIAQLSDVVQMGRIIAKRRIQGRTVYEVKYLRRINKYQWKVNRSLFYGDEILGATEAWIIVYKNNLKIQNKRINHIKTKLRELPQELKDELAKKQALQKKIDKLQKRL